MARRGTSVAGDEDVGFVADAESAGEELLLDKSAFELGHQDAVFVRGVFGWA